MRLALPALLALAALAAAAPAAATEIDWHKGDVPSAFARAKQEGKPLFLYWGAVWCPPCNQIKKTVFTRREFIDKTRLFVPVYLDGDTESAQIWGEKLKASGYPTMILMSPEGKELLRMPTGLQVERFVAVLDEALTRLKPVGEVLDATLGAARPADVPDQSFRLLAYYSWGQDESLGLTGAAKEEKFRKLEARTPARLKAEKSRLYAEWLMSRVELAADKGKEKGKPLTPAERKTARSRIEAIHADPDLVIANLEFLEGAAGDVVKALEPEPGPGRASLMKLWDATMAGVEKNEALSVDERLSALLPAIDFHELENGDKAPPDPKLQERVRAAVRAADAGAKDGYTRQAAVSTAGHLLRHAGLEAEAKQFYLAQLEKVPSPYYFMSSLADIAKEAGKKDEAIGWMRKAYETAEGPATRFQWGTAYLNGLIDLAPDDAARVKDESLRVLREVLGHGDAFAGRNQARMGRLDKKYKQWNAKGAHQAEVDAVRVALEPSCAGLGADPVEGGTESMRGRCTAFFAGLGANPADPATKVAGPAR